MLHSCNISTFREFLTWLFAPKYARVLDNGHTCSNSNNHVTPKDVIHTEAFNLSKFINPQSMGLISRIRGSRNALF